MADCSYARCLQERRSIRRELQRWTKNMVYVVGLERVAEELMGRRKWKLYQDVLLARNLPLGAGGERPPEASADEDEGTAAQPQQEPEKLASPGATSPASATSEQENNDQDKDEMKDQEQDVEMKEEGVEEVQLAPQTMLKIKTIEEINTVTDAAAAVAPVEEEKSSTILESLIKRSSAGPPRRPPPQQPVDWQPLDKCNYCVDGELVRPTTAAPEAAPEQPPSPVESESGSSSSRSGASPPRSQYQLLGPQAQALAHLLQMQQARGHPSMNQLQMQSMALAAVAALGGGAGAAGSSLLVPPALLPQWYMAQQRAARASTPERGTLDGDKSGSGSGAGGSEQPLDLSAKGSSGDPSTPGPLEARLALPADPKSIFNRAKPRLGGAGGGRRAYSEAELQMALRDIQSGRLGTRRAAVIYNIPRSTLRNKVYKLAVEREREARLPGQPPTDRDDSNDIVDDVDDDKDSVADEDKDDERELQQPFLSMEDILRFHNTDSSAYGNADVRNLLQKGGPKFFHTESPKRDSTPDVWSGMDQSFMRPYIQSILLASSLGAPMPKAEENSAHSMMPEIARLLAVENHNNILKEHLTKRDHINNGKPPDLSDDNDNSKRLFSRQSSSASSVITRNDRVTPGIKTDSPDDMVMDITDQNESRESPSNVILKIPSFKPLAQGSKNGGEGFSGPATPPLPYFSRSPLPEAALVGARPGDRSSPTSAYNKGSFSLKDVIAKSISQKFQQQGPPHQNHNNEMNQMKVSSPGMDAMEGLNAFKRGRMTPPMGVQGISVIKNLASHDLTRNFSNNSSSNQNQQNNSSGGKGTRPKRGKYRNYDRDSLVEAVKAVQRGEMSVHRAGSYYGVPHSTLEYKVKERHLMRPRKREPKNPNPEEKITPGVSKPAEMTPGNALRTDKPKPMQKPPMKPNFPAGSPNGLKMPQIFDGGLGLGYNPPPFPFWPHGPPFHGLPVDFNARNPAAGAAGFPPNPESYFASQMMQRLQEESARQPGSAAGGQKSNSLMKSAREMAEFYEGASSGAGANGSSFLEGIIRNSLEQQSGGQEKGEGVRRPLRPDDLLIAEEMREAARRLRAREGTAPAPTPAQPPPPHSS